MSFPQDRHPKVRARIEGGVVALLMYDVGHPDVDPEAEVLVALLPPAETRQLGLQLLQLAQDLQHGNGLGP